MGNCCKSAQDPIQNIIDTLQTIVYECPTATCIVFFTPNDNLLASVRGQPPQELIDLLPTFKKNITSFGASLQQQDGSVVHVRGKSSMLSCYDVDRYMLAFYSDIPPNSDVFETSSLDERLQPILQTLRVHIQTIDEKQIKKKKR